VGFGVDDFAEMANWYQAKNVKVLLDANGVPLDGTSGFAMMPNLNEFAQLIGRDLEELEADLGLVAQEAREEVGRNGNIQVMIVTLGPRGAILATKKSAFQIVPPRIEPSRIKSTIMAGDAFMAGFAYAYFHPASAYRENLLEAVRFAVATGTAKVLLPFNQLPGIAQINAILSQVEVKEFR
jgi:6-phosphofructokinase 2